MSRPLRFIPTAEEQYLLLLMGHPSPEGKERGLERLCAHYQRGYRLKFPHPFHQAFIACLYAPPNVRRWALNAIALAGTKAVHLQPVLEAIERNRDHDDIFAAAIGALVALTKEAEHPALLKQAKVSLDGVALLAAAQQARSLRGELARRRVNIDTASPAELRLAAILVGLGKAPEHLFDIGHANADVIGRLDAHPDALVAQYAVWAICENPDLGLAHMSSPIQDVESRPERVRSYAYRLITQDSASALAHRELVQVGSEDPSARARGGLASGLSRAYFEGVESITLDWLDAEDDPDIREGLLDHVVVFSDRSIIYEEKAKDEYDRAGLTSVRRARMRAAAQGLPLYVHFKKTDLVGESGLLFADAPLFGDTHVTKVTGHNIYAGNIGDNANINGPISVGNTTHTGIAVDELGKLLSLLNQAGEDPQVKTGKELIEAARANPTKGAVGKVLAWMKSLSEATGYAVTTAEGFKQAYEALGTVIDKLPI